MTENMREIIYNALDSAYELGYVNHVAGNMATLDSTKILDMMMDSIELAMMREETSDGQKGMQFDKVEIFDNDCEECLCSRCVTNEYVCVESCCGVTCPDGRCVTACPNFKGE